MRDGFSRKNKLLGKVLLIFEKIKIEIIEVVNYLGYDNKCGLISAKSLQVLCFLRITNGAPNEPVGS